MGKLVAKAKISDKKLYQQYQTILMEALQLKNNAQKNCECPTTHDGLF